VYHPTLGAMGMQIWQLALVARLDTKPIGAYCESGERRTERGTRRTTGSLAQQLAHSSYPPNT
jgi:hypothetical protein